MTIDNEGTDMNPQTITYKDRTLILTPGGDIEVPGLGEYRAIHSATEAIDWNIEERNAKAKAKALRDVGAFTKPEKPEPVDAIYLRRGKYIKISVTSVKGSTSRYSSNRSIETAYCTDEFGKSVRVPGSHVLVSTEEEVAEIQRLSDAATAANRALSEFTNEHTFVVQVSREAHVVRFTRHPELDREFHPYFIEGPYLRVTELPEDEAQFENYYELTSAVMERYIADAGLVVAPGAGSRTMIPVALSAQHRALDQASKDANRAHQKLYSEIRKRTEDAMADMLDRVNLYRAGMDRYKAGIA